MADATAKARTAEQIAREEDKRPMRDETPHAASAEVVNQDSRYNALRDTPPPLRSTLVWLLYEGRKGSRGAVRRTQDEHIDVIVPDDANAEQVDTYLDQAATGGVLTDQGRKDLAEAGLGPDTIQLSGSTYHFQAGSATPVLEEHTAWLLGHSGYSFKTVDDPR